MKIQRVLVVTMIATLAMSLIVLLAPKRTSQADIEEHSSPQEPQLNTLVREFLEEKESPLAKETDFLLKEKHWKLLIAISAIESQYCKIQVGNNCFGIGGDKSLRKYSSIRASLVDANDLIEYRQQEGRWLTPELMNCSYVFPCNDNWVNVVNKVIAELESYEQPLGAIHQ